MSALDFRNQAFTLMSHHCALRPGDGGVDGSW